jgi:hypothetical protein
MSVWLAWIIAGEIPPAYLEWVLTATENPRHLLLPVNSQKARFF